MAAKKKKPEEKGAGASGSTRSMRDAAQLARIPKSSPELKGQTAEEVLKSSESRYRRFFEAVRDGILIIDAETGTILDVNPFLIELLGFTHEQFLGKKLWEIGVFKDIAASKDNFKELQEKKYIHYEDLPLETADGRRIYSEFVCFVYDVEDKNVMQCNIRDITERKKAEEVLQESERRYRNLYQYAQVGLFETSFKDATIVACNQRYANLAGFTSVEEARGKDIVHLYVNPEDRAEVGRVLREQGFIENKTLELRNHSTRKIFWAQFSARFNFEREVAEGSIIDITPQKEAEIRLRESERRLQEAQEMAHLGFWTWDIRTGRVEWSDEVFRIFSLDPDTFIPRIDSILALSPWPEDQQRDRELIQRAMKSREPGSYEQRFLRPDKSTGYYHSTFEGRYDEAGNLVTIVGTALDITERKRMEGELKSHAEKLEEIVSERTRELREAQDQLVTKEKLAILGKLAGGVGHELRNPLGAIKNAAYFLNMALETPDPDVKEMVQLINKEVARSEDIISSLLDFARPKNLTLTKEAFATAVNGALKRNPVPDQVTVINNLDETLPRIPADQDKLLQVFNNIISNAFQAMPEGGSLTITSKQPDPEWVSISFTDTGEGISAENMKKLFEPLFTTKIKGIGLGMVVSKTIVELHGGHIDVRSKAGKGTTVTVNLPMRGRQGGMK
jgi:PAS domain S-box-containing protein